MADEFAPGSGPKCQCGFLEREARRPDSPIRFDVEMNEYYFSYFNDGGEEANLIIYHCTFCGGAAPDSLRPSKFAMLSNGELERLRELTKDLKTVDLVLAAFGKPDSDEQQGVMWTMPETDGHGEIPGGLRTLTYRNLSQTADVLVTVRLDDKTQITFIGKYLGESGEQ
ncbi:MAG: hypothetical protein MOB07_17585 [Acidobacteria bacterium]|nr:hypothetical protein [Acidobacteriota bacterium]